MSRGRDFAAKPALAGEKAVLRPFNDDDLPAIRAALLDPEARILAGSVHDEAQVRAPEAPDEEKPLHDLCPRRVTGIPVCPQVLIPLSVISPARIACRACKRRTTSHLVGPRAGGFGAARSPA